jgi:twitching motility protein PilJ
MSFLDKFKNKGWAKGPDDGGSPFDEMDAMPDASGAATLEMPNPGASTLTSNEDTSIISEAAPSEMAGDFTETRIRAAESPEMEPAGTGLPLIGQWAPDQQQRTLVGLFVLGLLGLGLATFLALSAANRGALQVGASGQALMQSQRLAKSVSQALVGSPQAFPEMKESSEVLTRNVRGLSAGDETLA